MKKGPSRLGLSSRLKGRGLNKDKIFLIMSKYGAIGVKALKEATPVETGMTADNWTYSVSNVSLIFKNGEVTVFGVPIPILIMYGYTNGRRHVNGNDFVRRTLDPIIKSLKEEIRKELL
jgi:hypothetical protein